MPRDEMWRKERKSFVDYKHTHRKYYILCDSKLFPEKQKKIKIKQRNHLNHRHATRRYKRSREEFFFFLSTEEISTQRKERSTRARDVAFYNLANLFLVRCEEWNFPTNTMLCAESIHEIIVARAYHIISHLSWRDRNMKLPNGLTVYLGCVKLAIHAWISMWQYI